MIVVRAFSYFSHLANLAEDVHTGRLRRQSEIVGEPPADGSLARALDRIEAAGVDRAALAAFFRDGQVVPVLTAHPTEVQRKSVRDLEMQLESAAAHPRPQPPDATGAQRQRRIDPPHGAGAVADPHAAAREARRARRGGQRPVVLRPDLPARGAAAVLRAAGRTAPSPGRAGRPRICPRSCGSARGSAATATATRSSPPTCSARTLRLQSSKVFAHYLEQLHELGRRAVDHDPGHARLRRNSTHWPSVRPTRSPHRRDEPYRRAITGLYARVAATARALDQLEPLRHAIADAPPYANVAEFAADLDIIHRSLEGHGSALLARGRLRRLRCAVEGVRLPPGRRRPAPELRRARARRRRTLLRRRGRRSATRTLDEAGRVRVLVEELATPRLLSSPYVDYSAETRDELDDPAHRRADARALRRGVHRELRDLEVRLRLRRARGRAAAARGRPLSRGGRGPGLQRRAAVRDHRRPASRRGGHGRSSCRSRCTRACSPRAGPRRRSCSGTPTATRTAATSPRAGNCSRRRSRWSRRSGDTASACGCSTVVAARSVAAAARRTRPSSPSPAARCRARSASPSRAR